MTTSLTASSLPACSIDELADILRSRGVDTRTLLPTASRPTTVVGMSIDSRTVEEGNLFVCKGAAFKPQFLADAIGRGAAAYLCEAADADLDAPAELAAAAPDTPAIVVSNVRRAMALVAPAIYNHPERDLTICGITGTKGKSTVAYMLRSIMTAADIDTSILGSIETDDGVQHFESHNTTPESPDLWRHLHNTVASGRHHMIMEVSSQGLKYDRVLGLPLSIGCFLNIGRDHISSVEHPTFEDYFASKLRIFEQCDVAVVNLGTDHVEEVLAAARQARRVVTLQAIHAQTSTSEASIPAADFTANNVESTPAGLSFDVLEGEERHRITLGMAGLFNVDNALAAIACARLMGVSYDAIAAGLAHVRVPGRMELVPSADGRVLAIVDYAHNELSFKTLFGSVKAEYPERRIIAVFGAPGGKAQERREVLPRVAGEYADLIIYTEEDPAHERVEDICAELASNTPAGVAHAVICDREAAVRRALEAGMDAPEGAVVLLLAKGDETRQHRGDDYPEVKSDLALAREFLGASGR
ncbi:UDP-N-acetylmuramoyl-L-alanyl-D-glutamate--2,6-diaminopimelate ligase [Collinsella sp. An2]|uniref:Mur ligase family protein n=1 Tax=Collinsella sp. An2 TaxID=1965585 RepID=UPI001EF4395A|nr:UDP-N-acetylmuramoyl-L-alanyl-D-glutamate--2,6-diaminopimelate ligase [Collinsella sp. An2]